MKSAGEAFNIKVPILGQSQKTNVKPLFDWLFCARVDAPQVSAGNIQLVGTDARPYEEAEVVHCGPESKSVKPGQRIQFIGRCPTITVDGVEYYLIRDALPPIGMALTYNGEGEPTHPAFIACILERETTLQ